MDPSRLRGAPPLVPPSLQGQSHSGAPLAMPSQDARSNLAIQPAANAGTFKLKKNAVKIIGAATPPSGAPVRAAAISVSAIPASPPVPERVDAQPKVAERDRPTTPLAAPLRVPKPMSSEPEVRSLPDEADAELETLFKRLTAKTSILSPNSRDSLSTDRPTGMLTSDNASTAQSAQENVSQSAMAQQSMPEMEGDGKHHEVTPPTNGSEVADARAHVFADENVSKLKDEAPSTADLEQQYLGKALEYVCALPATTNISVQTIKTVAVKLQDSYAPNSNIDELARNKLKARYALAINQYIKTTKKDNVETISVDSIKQLLENARGNLLVICAELVEKRLIDLEDLSNVTGLCQIILNILPQAEFISGCKEIVLDQTKQLVSGNEPVVQVHGQKINTWPVQEKRETPAAYRACILKGVSGIKTINQLQALVWGGRLESIAIPAAGSDFAVIKFLSPAGCDKYFKDTENGIEIQGNKRALVFVEKQPGPSSINDVIRNCNEGNASRCVRALDADEDWSDMMLMKIARGKGAVKRDVDCVKRGKTAKGRYYIEFRFANIYHALNLKRELDDDPDWEACVMKYAPDPCETACGIHYTEENENASTICV